MRKIVSGGCGFIGSNLVEELAKQKVHVSVYDNLTTGSLANLPKSSFVQYRTWFKKNHNCDTIFHLGIPSSTPLYRQNRSLVWRALKDFTYILEYCRECDVKLIYASSSSLYNQWIPFIGGQAEHLDVHNTDFYTEARYYMERLAQTYFDFYGVNSVGLRLFSVYGKNDWRKEQYANLITQAIIANKKNDFFKIYGDGEQTRDFTYVKDVVRAFLLAEKYKPKGAFIFNVGTGTETTINEMLKMVGNNKKEYVENPLKNYVNRTCASTTLAQRELGFKAKYSLKDGLKDYLKVENWKEAIR